MIRTSVAASLLFLSLTAIPAYGQIPNVRCPHFPALHDAKMAQDELLLEFRRTRQCSLIARIQRTIRQGAIHLERALRDCRGIRFPPDLGRKAAADIERWLRPLCR